MSFVLDAHDHSGRPRIATRRRSRVVCHENVSGSGGVPLGQSARREVAPPRFQGPGQRIEAASVAEFSEDGGDGTQGLASPAQQVRQFGVAHVLRKVLAVCGSRGGVRVPARSEVRKGGRVEREVAGEFTDAVRRPSAGRRIRGDGSEV